MIPAVVLRRSGLSGADQRFILHLFKLHRFCFFIFFTMAVSDFSAFLTVISPHLVKKKKNKFVKLSLNCTVCTFPKCYVLDFLLSFWRL